MGIETALLFCAIRANEVLGTLSFTRDTRTEYETALCLRKTGYSLSNDLDLCVNAPALLLDATGNPRRFGSWSSSSSKLARGRSCSSRLSAMASNFAKRLDKLERLAAELLSRTVAHRSLPFDPDFTVED